MYRIYVDDELLYSPEVSSNKPEYALTNATMSLELNKAGSVQFTMPPTHYLYNKLKHLSTDVRVIFAKGWGATEKTRFYGRVFDTTRDFNNNKEVLCEGDLAFLNDSTQRPFSFVQPPKWAFATFVHRHNAEIKHSYNRRFQVGKCDMSTDDIAEGATSYGTYIYTNGSKINHTSTAGSGASDSEIGFATAGMLYLNRQTYRLYKCTVGGEPAVAMWAYVGNIQPVLGSVPSQNVIFHGEEISGTFGTPTEFNLSNVDKLEVGDRYINNTTYAIYECTQRALTDEERQASDVDYDNLPKNLWKYRGNIARMVGTADKRVSANAIFFKDENYTNSWELFSNTLVGSLGGYLYTDEPSTGGSGRFLNWTKEPGVKASQVIKFGQNLLDFSEHISAENIVTRIIPLGPEVTDSDGNSLGYRLTVNSANNGLDYVENFVGIDLFGDITRMVEFESGTTPKLLLDLAKTYLQESMKLALSIELTALDLSLIDINADDIRVGNSYRVVSEPHGIDDYFICSKAEIDILHPENSKFTFGVDKATLTGLTTKSNFVTAADAPVYIKSSETYWLVNDDPEAKPDVHDDAWSTDTPTWSSTTYVWQKTVDTYSDGTIKESDPICLTGYHGESTISVTVTSSAGDMFLRRDISTILTCNVYYGTKDYSDHVTSYHWVKKDKDGNVDDTWSRMPGKSISITGDDVNTKAIFDCEVTLVI